MRNGFHVKMASVKRCPANRMVEIYIFGQFSTIWTLRKISSRQSRSRYIFINTYLIRGGIGIHVKNRSVQKERERRPQKILIVLGSFEI